MKPEAIILDTNLLILLIVGLSRADRFANHKNLKNFHLPSDFEILQSLLHGISQIILTPNTLTETSNLLRQIANPARNELSRMLGHFLQNCPEVYIRSVDAAGQLNFEKLGLTDAALLHLLADQTQQDQRLLLTMDLDLYLAATALELKAINFNEFRDM